MKLEVGKYYKTREGYRVGPMRKTGSPYANMRFTDDEVNHWTENGTEYNTMPSDLDLIAEWVDDPVTGTLRELNVQVGDVVMMCDDLEEEKMTVISGPESRSVFVDHYEIGDGLFHENSEDWRIISRASLPSPVITETVTTQRIEPGVYGIVDLAGVDNDMVQIRLHSTDALKTWFAASELTDAIATLTQIRDALTHNSAK